VGKGKRPSEAPAFRRGECHQRSDGRWQASLQIDGKRRTVYASTKREAKAKLRKLQQQAETTGSMPISVRHSVSQLIDAWLETAPDLKSSTINQYRMFYETYARASLGSIRLDRVTPNSLQRLYASLTPAVGEKLHRVLHRAFAVAVMWRWLATNPCDHVLKPVYKTPQKVLWTQAELSKFLTQTTAHWLNPVWVLLMATGCRLGEALALGWDDVNLDGAVMTISRTLHRIDGEWVLDTAKTDSSARTIALPAVAVDAVRRQVQQQAAWRESAGSEWEAWGLVFTGKTGKPLFASTIQHALKRECARLGIPAVTPHGLRHLHASLLLDEGVPITAVSARLGHANPQITMKIYAHSPARTNAQRMLSGMCWAEGTEWSRTAIRLNK
jgi:integrase